MIQKSLIGDAVPRARTSYTPEHHESRPDAGSRDQASSASWLTRERIAAALVRAARRAGKPLDAGDLAATAGIGHLLPVRLRDEVLAELAHSGDLILERRQNPRALWERSELYSLPKGV